MTVLNEIADDGRIALVRALQLGDLLCAVPAMRALRAAKPRAEITLIGLPWSVEFASRFSAYIDRFVEFPGFPGIDERPTVELDFAVWLQCQRRELFDLAIQLHGSGSFINPFTWLLRSRRHAGFYVPGTGCPNPRTYLPWPATGHESERLSRLIAFLGGRGGSDELEFPLTSSDRQEFGRLEEHAELRRGEYVCLHPGGRLFSRRWRIDKFAQVAQQLMQRGYQVVITGAATESTLADELATLAPGSINLAGRTSLGGLAMVLRHAGLLISNDTAVSHIAAALHIPSVIIVLGSDPSRWMPLNADLHEPVLHEVECRPCSFRECPIGFVCEAELSVSRVMAAVDRKLATIKSSRDEIIAGQLEALTQIAPERDRVCADSAFQLGTYTATICGI